MEQEATGPAKRAGRERGEEGERKKEERKRKWEKNGERKRERERRERGEICAGSAARGRPRVRGPGGDGARAALAAKRRPGARGREWKREREIHGDDRDRR